MTKYYPMATYGGKTDNFHTLTSYDSLSSIRECLDAIETWITCGYKIDRCWIQKISCCQDYTTSKIDIDVKFTDLGEPYVIE